MSSVTESAFKSRMAEQMHVSEEQLANVSVEDIGKSMGIFVTSNVRKARHSRYTSFSNRSNVYGTGFWSLMTNP